MQFIVIIFQYTTKVPYICLDDIISFIDIFESLTKIIRKIKLLVTGRERKIDLHIAYKKKILKIFTVRIL